MKFLKKILNLKKAIKIETTYDDLFAPVSGINKNELLLDWHWLVGESAEPLLITALGDVFYRSGNGIFFLDVNWGQSDALEKGYQEFREDPWGNDEEFGTRYAPDFVAKLRESGIILNSGQCYSFKKPPCFGGNMVIGNISTCDVTVHISLMGQLYYKLKDVPPGTKISGISLELAD
ncbi:T6SS immunity protein Tdi1 domain-containing protein [Microbulbifer sp. A4B17]|uniref:T6SS immunity protein Tdi1 domain-containing protein n=1 Tax=Microbulbifer sp. A4B17 TaxID=359370 RepID=UPI001300744E|nr:T6SS immunity protein Tdi1 domain-containing protein [Microbulbifer sp. A4B17]